jgi:hypothetical protein
MASIVLAGFSASGALSGWGTAAIILAQAGAMALDSALIYPALFPQPDQKGPRLDDLQLQGTAEGGPSNRPYGSGVRVAGMLVWKTNLREIKNTESGGGKGGSGGDFITYQYDVDCVIRIAKIGKPISRVLEVIADGKPFWKALPDIDLSGGFISAIAVGSFSFAEEDPDDGNNDNEIWSCDATLDLISDELAGGPDLSQFKSGKEIVIAGFTNAIDPGLQSGALKANSAITYTGGLGTRSLSVISTGTGTLYQGETIRIGPTSTIDYTLLDTYVFTGTIPSPHIQPIRLVDKTLRFQDTVAVGDLIIPTSHTTRNNGTRTVETSGRDDAANTSFVRVRRKTSGTFYDVPPVQVWMGFCGMTQGNDSLDLGQELPTHSEKQVKDVRFYNGDQNQQADNVVTAIEENRVGVGNVLGWRGRAVMVLEELNLTDFGNRLPSFEFIVEVAGTTVTVGETIAEILEDGGFGEAEYDVSGVTGNFIGLNIRGAQKPKTILQPLYIAYQFISYESEGKTFFQDKETIQTLTPLLDDLTTHAPGQTVRRLMNVQDVAELKNLNALTIKYRDPEEAYQTKEARALRTTPIPGADTEEISLDLALPKDEAQQLAATLFAQSKASARAVQIRLPPSYEGRIREGLALNLLGVYGQDWRVIVARVERGADNIFIVEAYEDDLESYDQVVITAESSGSSSGGPDTQDGPNNVATLIDSVLFEVAPLKDSHRHEVGFYLAATNSDQRRAWRGAGLYRSTDAGVSYINTHRITHEAVIGRVISSTEVPVLVEVIDRVNTIRVEIVNHAFELSSVTEEECRQGHRMYLIGKEVVGAATATLVSTNALTGAKTYDLTVLRRGLRDTEDEMLDADPGAPFVWLNGPGIEFVPGNTAAAKQRDYYKIIAPGSDIALAGEKTFAVLGATLRPLGVGQVHGSRDANNNLTVTWERQSRMIVKGVDQGAPLEEDIERYRVEFFDGATLVRTSTVDDLRTVSYLATAQTADGLTPGDPVLLHITQLSNRVLEGRTVIRTV